MRAIFFLSTILAAAPAWAGSGSPGYYGLAVDTNPTLKDCTGPLIGQGAAARAYCAKIPSAWLADGSSIDNLGFVPARSGANTDILSLSGLSALSVAGTPSITPAVPLLTPQTGVWIAGNNALNPCPGLRIAGCNGQSTALGVPVWTNIASAVETVRGPVQSENNAFFQMISKDGTTTPWSSETAYVADQYVDNTDYLPVGQAGVYKQTAETCTSGTSYPDGTGTGIVDGTCLWDYQGSSAVISKNNLQAITVVMPGAGKTWNATAGMNVQAGWDGPGAINYEMGARNYSSVVDVSTAGNHRITNLYLSGPYGNRAAFPITNMIYMAPGGAAPVPAWAPETAYTAASFADTEAHNSGQTTVYKQTTPSCVSGTTSWPTGTGTGIVDGTCLWDYNSADATAHHGALEGLWIDGRYSIRDHAIRVSTSSKVGYWDSSISHETASISLAATSPAGILMTGTYSAAAISIPDNSNICLDGYASCLRHNSSTGLAALSVGLKVTGDSTGHAGLLIDGTTDRGIWLTETDSQGLWDQGTHSVASVSLAGTAPYGLLLNGTYSTAAISASSGDKICLNGNAACVYYDGARTVIPNAIKVAPLAYASLPTCDTAATGTIANVTDATVNTYNATVSTGGGSYKGIVFCNGSVWSFR